MDTTCKNCNHWENDSPKVENRDNFGECDVLGGEGMQFVLPVVQSKSAPILTAADFGCNQFDAG